ncbi:glycoside hydrolase family 18 protein [Bacillus sp. sid0103]|uniref:glycosyl hydrolase family 18 protein n=1 Tax=Bacillus sp. sid0103 TaxID=2856337 RepID=UPI001C4858F2|nr:glycoside hydrolase family 18 protein [Bacillus sp. sid0103]MBV7506476.1 glycoside hydrolase family 18 protein [Bacillus sp. sid0103]
MNKRHLLLGLVIAVTFIGGIFTGVFFSSNNQKHERPSTLIIEDAPKSAIMPNAKELPNVKKAPSKVLIGYVQDYRDPNIVDYSKLSHVIFSFVHPTKDGTVLFNGDLALKNLRTVVAKAEKHDTKVILAIGGWFHIKGGESYNYFKPAISNPKSRAKLVKELTNIAVRENLDGIDIDFEHPRTTADAKNLTAFAKELSAQLHPKKKELSVAVYSKIHAVTLTEVGFIQYEPSMFQYVDHVNIMAYDGQWDGGYNAANLSPYPFTEKIVNYWTNLFDSKKLSKEKLVLGVPFYAQPENPKIKQVSYAAIINKNPANAGKDTVKMNGTTYHYNGGPTMKKKTRLALDHGFGGMMLWEAGLDSQGSHSLTGTIFSEIKASSKEPVKYYTAKGY